MIIKIIILIGLVKLLQSTQSATLCASIYAVVALLITFLTQGNFVAALIVGAVAFVTSFLYFWMLLKTEGGWLWWVILIGGAAIGLI